MKVPPLLAQAVADLVNFLAEGPGDNKTQYEALQDRFAALKRVTQSIECALSGDEMGLKALHEWYRQQTDPFFLSARLGHRVRTWPAGRPGEYLTLEAIYSNTPEGSGLAKLLDRWLLSQRLAVAIRSRLHKLAQTLNGRTTEEAGRANWLTVRCGSCRELLSVPSRGPSRTIHCLDADRNALDYAAQVLAPRNGDTRNFLNDHAFNLLNPRRNLERFGALTTIYSVGLFDYVDSDHLGRLLAALYGSLANGGLLLVPVMDGAQYDTFDCHWNARWYQLCQRTEAEFWQIFMHARIPLKNVAVDRDDSGAVLFFLVRK